MSSFEEKRRAPSIGLPPPAQLHSRGRSFSRLQWILALAFASAICYTFQPATNGIPALWAEPEGDLASLCPQVAAFSPSKNTRLFETLSQTYKTEAFLQRAVELLGGAVRIPYVPLLYSVMALRWPHLLGIVRNLTTTWVPLVRILGGTRLGLSTSTCSRRTLECWCLS